MDKKRLKQLIVVSFVVFRNFFVKARGGGEGEGVWDRGRAWGCGERGVG